LLVLVFILSQRAEILQDPQKSLQMNVPFSKVNHWPTSLAWRIAQEYTWVDNSRFDNCPGQD
jgi:hypothetical protein